jgi:UPF0716 protein FxsA
MMPLLFLLYPFCEAYAWYLFIDRYSFFDAFLLAFSVGGVGLLVMRSQGQTALQNTQLSLAQGKLPSSKIFHSALIMLGGLLLFIPGLLSKFAGTMLVLPGFRHLAVWYLKWYLAGKISKGTFRVFMASGFPGFGGGFTVDRHPQERDVVDVKPSEIEHKDK